MLPLHPRRFISDKKENGQDKGRVDNLSSHSIITEDKNSFSSEFQEYLKMTNSDAESDFQS